MKINYQAIEAFQKDLKRLLKRFRTLGADLENLKKYALENFHCAGIDNHGIVQIPHFTTEAIQIYKVRKFACKSLKGRGAKSGLRVIYAFHPQALKIAFIELYFKGDKDNEDKERIKSYLLA